MKNVELWIDEADIEQSALDQIKLVSTHPRLAAHVAIMPDVHAGIGCTIGSVIPLDDAVCPAFVGVDIGCGLIASKSDGVTGESIRGRFKDIHAAISAAIPMGFSHRTEPLESDVEEAWIRALYPERDIALQLGTLGGGNHFIELQTDGYDNVWVMIHSGSRNIGNLIARAGMKAAEAAQPTIPVEGSFLEVDSKDGMEYIRQMNWALDFAMRNREAMMNIVTHIVGGDWNTPINIHHNYAALEEHYGRDMWVHRKGATSARRGETGIIPGSMGVPSYITSGLGRVKSFHSCAHGAGRCMSRTAAKGRWNRKRGEFVTEGALTMDGFKADMAGVFTRDINREHLDEAPGAYKNISQVMRNQAELTQITYELTPIFNMKG